MNNLYMLTDMTGKTSQTDRTAVVGTFEMRRRHLVIGAAALISGLIPQLLLFPLFGSWGLLLVPFNLVVLLFIFESRRREGLRLRQWEYLRDRGTASAEGRLYLCGAPIESLSTFRRVAPSSRPLVSVDTSRPGEKSADDDTVDFTDLIDEEAA